MWAGAAARELAAAGRWPADGGRHARVADVGRPQLGGGVPSIVAAIFVIVSVRRSCSGGGVWHRCELAGAAVPDLSAGGGEPYTSDGGERCGLWQCACPVGRLPCSRGDSCGQCVTGGGADRDAVRSSSNSRSRPGSPCYLRTTAGQSPTRGSESAAPHAAVSRRRRQPTVAAKTGRRSLHLVASSRIRHRHGSPLFVLPFSFPLFVVVNGGDAFQSRRLTAATTEVSRVARV